MRFSPRPLLAIGVIVVTVFGTEMGLAQVAGVTMPTVVERFDAEYPLDAANAAPVTVVLFVSLDVHGHVTAAEVAESADESRSKNSG